MAERPQRRDLCIQRRNVPYTCRESLMVLSALTSALTQELSSSHAHKLRSLRLHFAAHAPEEDDDSSNHDLNEKRNTSVGSTIGLPSTPHVRTTIEQALIGSSDPPVKEGITSLNLGPGGTSSLSRSSFAAQARRLLYDPSLYVRDEAAFALWHAKQRYMVSPCAMCYLPARQG